MAMSERWMVDAEVLALEELNAAGGLLGRPVRWGAGDRDGASDPTTFAREAERLVREEKVSVLFGCWTSAAARACCRSSRRPTTCSLSMACCELRNRRR